MTVRQAMQYVYAIYAENLGTVNLIGGKISFNGKKTNSSVSAVGLVESFAGELNITGTEIYSNCGPAVNGSPASCNINISGGKLKSDGSYGIQCLGNSTLNLSGNIDITGILGGIYVPKDNPINITGIITGANTSIYAEASGAVTKGLNKYVPEEVLNAFLKRINANGELSIDKDGEIIIALPEPNQTVTTTSTTTTSPTTSTAVSSTTNSALKRYIVYNEGMTWSDAETY